MNICQWSPGDGTATKPGLQLLMHFQPHAAESACFLWALRAEKKQPWESTLAPEASGLSFGLLLLLFCLKSFI